MQSKITLTEQFIIFDEIPSILKDKLNLDRIQTNILQNYSDNKFQSDDVFNYHKDYVHVDDDQHLTWIIDYIRDHYRGEYMKTPVIKQRAALVQNKGHTINTHHHIDEFDLWNSPDISCIYTLSDNEIPSDLIFEYDKGREKHARYRIPLFHNRFVLFNSELNHYLTPNKNDEPIVNLSFQFQLL
jgi:hypothetical protein